MRNILPRAGLFAIFLAFFLLAGCVWDGGESVAPADESKPPESESAQTPELPDKDLENKDAPPAGGEPAPPQGEAGFSPGDAVVDISSFKKDTDAQKTIASVLSSYRWGDEKSLDNANELLELEADAADDLIELSKNENIYAKWSALYAFSSVAKKTGGEERDAVASRLEKMADEEKNPSMRALSGSLLLSLGKKEGFGPLLDSLNETDTLFGSQPPMAVCSWADYSLMRYSGEDFAFSCSGENYDTAGAQKWKEWWGENKDSLAWDGEKFSVK